MKIKLKKLALVVFLFLALVMYLLILFGSKIGLNFKVSVVCYLVIILCFIYALFSYNGKRDNSLVIIALFITLIADYFLVLYGNLLEGMFVFCFAQITYFLRIFFSFSSKRKRIMMLAIAFMFMISLYFVCFAVVKSDFEYLIVFALFYFSFMLTNCIFSGINLKRNLLFFIGLILFLCCDYFVGLPFLIDILRISSDSIFSKLLNYPFNFVWFFYAPSQVMIVLSMSFNREQKRII